MLAAGGGLVTSGGVIAGGEGGASGNGFNYRGTYGWGGGHGPNGGAGGRGAILAGGAIAKVQGGSISGGAGGSGGENYFAGAGGAGGSAVSLSYAGVLNNLTGRLVGGTGGAGASGGYLYPPYGGPMLGRGGAGGAGGAGLEAVGAATVTNTGMIIGGAGGSGGAPTTGSTAGIGGAGGAGMSLGGVGSLVNTGSIVGGLGGAAGGAAASGLQGAGVVVTAGGSVRNGVKTVPTALISGNIGVDAGAGGVATVTNFGTIVGTGGTAVRFASAGDRLIAMGGSKLIGQAQGGGGTLELASGTGTISGLGAGASISGAMTMAFGGFGTYQLDGGSWTLTGNSSLAAGQVLNAHGPTSAASTTVTGVLTNAGLLEATTAAGLILSQTTVANAGGTITATSGSKVMLEGVTINGGIITSSGSGKILTANGTFNVLDGSVSTITLPALTSLTVSDTTFVILKGNIVNSGKISLSALTHSAKVTIGGTGVTLSGGGAVTLSANAGNLIAGASGLVLTNVDNKITGGGAIGGGALTIVNQANGLIEQTGTVALNLSSGAHTIVNAGVIEAAGTGGMTIKSAVANTGLLEAVKGNLTATGAVTGTGSAIVNAATLYFASTFSENVKFSGTTGVLELAKSTTYTGTITGFSKLGTTQFDLLDIGFVAGATKATYGGTTAGGTLTVTDGTHTAMIKLTGNYTNSTFVVATDNHGGTLIHDPTAPVSPSPAAMASAMAGMGGASGAPAHWTAPEPTRFLALAAPVSLR